MNTSPLQVQAANALSTVEAAKQVLQAAVAAAEKACSESCKASYDVLRALQSRYEELAYGLACEDGCVPYRRSGSFMRHDNCEVEAEGLQLQWYEDNGPDTWFLATWEALEAAEAQEAALRSGARA